MRRSPKCEFYEDGIVMEADFCAEHEWGIDEIKDNFGIPKFDKYSGVGIETIKITKIPVREPFRTGMIYEESNNNAIFISNWATYNCPYEDIFRGKNEPISACWDSKGFAIHVSTKENVDKLRVLHEYFQKIDMLIYLNRFNLFGNNGLVLYPHSKWPKNAEQILIDSCNQRILINKEVLESGIEDTLKNSNKKYYDLSPKLKNGKLVFWLNPQDQLKYNYGWYTLEDLKLWAENKGPIVK